MHCQGTAEDVITYANLTEVYETEVYVSLNDVTGTLNVSPLDGPHRAALAATRQGLAKGELKDEKIR